MMEDTESEDGMLSSPLHDRWTLNGQRLFEKPTISQELEGLSEQMFCSDYSDDNASERSWPGHWDFIHNSTPDHTEDDNDDGDGGNHRHDLVIFSRPNLESRLTSFSRRPPPSSTALQQSKSTPSLCNDSASDTDHSVSTDDTLEPVPVIGGAPLASVFKESSTIFETHREPLESLERHFDVAFQDKVCDHLSELCSTFVAEPDQVLFDCLLQIQKSARGLWPLS